MRKKIVYVLLDNVRSAFNTGSIFRTSETAGINKLILCGITPYPPHLKLEKTALGTIQNVPWEYSKSTIEKIEELKKDGFTIISVETTDSAINYSDFNYPNKTCLVMGHELIGVSDEVLKVSDSVVKIPMYGKKVSLNVAVAAGIVIFESIKE